MEKEKEKGIHNSIASKNKLGFDSWCEYFKWCILQYVDTRNNSENGNMVYLKTNRLFHLFMGLPVGVNVKTYYKAKVRNVHIMSLVNALRKLRDEGKVEQKSLGVWVWKDNDGSGK